MDEDEDDNSKRLVYQTFEEWAENGTEISEALCRILYVADKLTEMRHFQFASQLRGAVSDINLLTGEFYVEYDEWLRHNKALKTLNRIVAKPPQLPE